MGNSVKHFCCLTKQGSDCIISYIARGCTMYGNPFQPWVNGPQMYQQANLPVYEEVEGPESIAYIQMMPNDRRVVFDKHRDRFYTIETDAACQKSVHAYDFVPADDGQPKPQPSSGLEDKLSSIEKRLDEIEQLVLQ